MFSNKFKKPTTKILKSTQRNCKYINKFKNTYYPLSVQGLTQGGNGGLTTGRKGSLLSCPINN